MLSDVPSASVTAKSLPACSSTPLPSLSEASFVFAPRARHVDAGGRVRGHVDAAQAQVGGRGAAADFLDAQVAAAAAVVDKRESGRHRPRP